MTNLLLILLLCTTSSLSLKHLKDPVVKAVSSNFQPQNDEITRNYTYYNFTVPLNHFAYASSETFTIRYAVNNNYYNPGGPIFFYTGNEGALEKFIAATGIMFDLAPLFNASLIFAEHRYYGASLPPNSFKNVTSTGFLTSQQALADYADLIYYLKNGQNHTDGSPTFDASTKIIAFGGSYGGMLAAWFRMKYPHLVAGAWASSAPLLYFNGGNVDWGVFSQITTRTFAESGCNNQNIVNGWKAIFNLSSTAAGCNALNTIFKVDNKSLIQNETGAYNLYYYVQEAFEYMAMTDYPYPTSFLRPIPGSPVKVACQFLNGTANFNDTQLVQMLADSIKIYYNYIGASNYTACIDPSVCVDSATSSLGSPLGWPWQECTEIVIEMCDRANTSFFLDSCLNSPLEEMYDYCKATFTMQSDGSNFGWTQGMLRENGVRNLYGLSVSAASNIILSQGHLDPWSGGGYQATSVGSNTSSGIYVIEIPGSAHHLDLRQPNSCDPNTIANARYQFVGILQCWLTTGCINPTLKPLPTYVESSSQNCVDLINQYPWGQQ